MYILYFILHCRCRQEVLGCIVSMYGRIHRSGCALHSSNSEREDSSVRGSAATETNTTAAAGNIQGSAATAGSVRGSGSTTIGSPAPIMDTLVALRLAIALVHARKQQHLLVRNRYVLRCYLFVLLYIYIYLNAY